MPKSDTILSAKSLRYFLQLIDTMNYTQAAQILGITQPALTQQIKKLEKAIGAPLFGQIGKKLYLTEAGNEMKSAAVELLNTINSVVDDIQEFTQLDKGSITIGILKTLDLEVLEDFLISFNEKYPKIVLNVDTYEREELWQKLDSNEIDLAIMYLPDTTKKDEINLHNQYEHKALYDDQVVVLTHKKNLESEDEYPVSRFLTRKWVTYPESFYLTQIMKESFGQRNQLDIKMFLPTTAQLVDLATKTGYDTFVTKSYYENNKQNIKLTPIYLKKTKQFYISIIYRKGKLEIPRIKNILTEWNKFLDKKDYSSRLEEKH